MRERDRQTEGENERRREVTVRWKNGAREKECMRVPYKMGESYATHKETLNYAMANISNKT